MPAPAPVNNNSSYVAPGTAEELRRYNLVNKGYGLVPPHTTNPIPNENHIHPGNQNPTRIPNYAMPAPTHIMAPPGYQAPPPYYLPAPDGRYHPSVNGGAGTGQMRRRHAHRGPPTTGTTLSLYDDLPRDGGTSSPSVKVENGHGPEEKPAFKIKKKNVTSQTQSAFSSHNGQSSPPNTRLKKKDH